MSYFKNTFGATEGAGSWPADTTSLGFETAAVHAGVVPDSSTGAILTPIVQSTTFVQQSVEDYLAKGFSYSRTANPTVSVLAEKLAALEGGAGAAVFGTGMAATVTLFTTLLRTGDHLVLTECSYGGTNRAARVLFRDRFGVDVTFVDATSLKAIEDAITPKTKLIFTESPANPVLTLTDVAAVSALAKKYGILHAVDSTFATPVIMKPLDLGADFVCISTTKFVDGHNMTVGGAIVWKDPVWADQVGLIQNIHGNIMAPMNAYLQLQSIKTLHLRITKQSHTAQKVAEMLEAHPKVLTVRYPGLASFPQKALADKQHKGGLHGGMLWFEVKGGVEAGKKLMNTTQRPWSLCENLGATESIITCPAVMTHANMLKEDREKLGINDGFIRISCGIEDTDDLVNALKVSLDAL